MLRVWGCDLGGHHADVVRVARQPLDRLLHAWRATRTLRLLHAAPVLLDRICEGGARSPVSSCAGLAIRGASKGPSNTPGHHEAPSSVFLAKAEGGHFWALHARVTATSGESTRSSTPRNTMHPRRPPMGQALGLEGGCHFRSCAATPRRSCWRSGAVTCRAAACEWSGSAHQDRLRVRAPLRERASPDGVAGLK